MMNRTIIQFGVFIVWARSMQCVSHQINSLDDLSHGPYLALAYSLSYLLLFLNHKI